MSRQMPNFSHAQAALIVRASRQRLEFKSAIEPFRGVASTVQSVCRVANATHRQSWRIGFAGLGLGAALIYYVYRRRSNRARVAQPVAESAWKRRLAFAYRSFQTAIRWWQLGQLMVGYRRQRSLEGGERQ